ncbi:DNA methyltransferase [Amycolatopsis sp. NPDC054798]
MRQAGGSARTRSLPRKNLVGIPWRVAFALQADGWILRNAIGWHKPNAMPESVRDRLSNRYEMVFLLTKQQKYFFDLDLDLIREPLARPEAVGEGLVIGGANKGGHGGIDASARRRGHSVYGKYRDTAPFAGKTPWDAMRPTGTDAIEEHNELIAVYRESGDPRKIAAVKWQRPVGPSSTHRINGILKTCLNRPVKQGLLVVNVASLVELPPAARWTPLVWTAERVLQWPVDGEDPVPGDGCGPRSRPAVFSTSR